MQLVKLCPRAPPADGEDDEGGVRDHLEERKAHGEEGRVWMELKADGPMD